MGSTRLVPILLLAALLPAQRTWIVNKAGGAGVDFTDIPPAIAAAAPGDMIKVLGDLSVMYSPFTLSKGLVIEAVSGASCGPGLTTFYPITVTQLPAGSFARISGFHLGGFAIPSAAVQVVSCAGRVMISRITNWAKDDDLAITDSASVLICDCAIGDGAKHIRPGNLPVAITRSRVVFQRCVLTGHHGEASSEVFTNGSSAISCSASSVLCANTTLLGGAGDDWKPDDEPCGSSGGTAVECTGGTCTLMGKSSIAGGAAGASPTCPGLPGSAASGSVLLSADVTLAGAAGSAQRIRSLAWIESPGVATLGAPVTVNLRGVPFTGMLLHIDESFGVTPLSGFETPYLGTLGAVYVAPFVIGPSGAVPFTFAVPYLPQCAGRTYYLHALAIEPGTNALSFTNLGDLLLR